MVTLLFCRIKIPYIKMYKKRKHKCFIFLLGRVFAQLMRALMRASPVAADKSDSVLEQIVRRRTDGAF